MGVWGGMWACEGMDGRIVIIVVLVCSVIPAPSSIIHRQSVLYVFVAGGGGTHMLDMQHVPVNRPSFLNCHLPNDPLFKKCWPTLYPMTPLLDIFFTQ